MNIERSSLIDRLPTDQRCLGAAFTSFAFDPRLFENQILRAVLGLSSDPDHQLRCFLEEGRARVQQTPVVAIVDAGQRQAGRRMPYDLLEVDAGVFHPKTALLLYENHALLQVSSANLTSGGYGGNAELSLLLEARYDSAEDAAVLRSFDAFMARCVGQCRQPGSQWELIRAELDRRLQAAHSDEDPGTASFALLESTTGTPLLEQIFALLPEGAHVRRVGALAPFFEADRPTLGSDSVFAKLLELAGPEAAFDVGVAWDNPAPSCELAEVPALDAHLDELWCWLDPKGASQEFMVPRRLLRTNFEYRDHRGRNQRWPIEDADGAREAKLLWPLGALSAFAPARALRQAAERFTSFEAWLFPATLLDEGRPRHRPLHAKLLLVSFELDGAIQTLVVVGSANLSRAALLRSVDRRGNVECCLGFCVAGEHRLFDFAPELVNVPLELLELRERGYPELGHHYGLCIEAARHDPAAATLEICWDRERAVAEKLPSWRLSYADEQLAEGCGAPSQDLLISDFRLRADNAELVLHVGERSFPVAILVTDLAKLPVRELELELSLESMLLVLGGRLGRERAAALEARAREAGAQAAGGLEAIFGEGFGPTDVFRAWWGVCADLRDPGLSVQGVRVALVGSLGLAAVWAKIRAAAKSESPALSATEAWFYGAELLRELERLDFGEGPSAAAKADELGGFITDLREELLELTPDPSAQPWLEHVLDFYGVRP